MPFTISHAVAVLPLVGSRRLVPAALVIGSWVPDLPYFVPGLPVSDWTHAASGPLTIDLILGLAVLALWRALLLRPLTDLAPGWLRERLPARPPASAAGLLAAAVSVAVGASTHVLWDTVTHPGRWGTRHLPVLTESLGPLPVFKWLQYGGGVLGLAGLAVWLVCWARRTPRSPVPPVVGPRVRRWSWSAVTAVFLTTVAAVLAAAVFRGRGWESSAFAVATVSMGVTAAAVVLVCLLWHLQPRTPDTP